jgi:hypothetical protein
MPLDVEQLLQRLESSGFEKEASTLHVLFSSAATAARSRPALSTSACVGVSPTVLAASAVPQRPGCRSRPNIWAAPSADRPQIRHRCWRITGRHWHCGAGTR